MYELDKAGYEVFIVGGYVRDKLLDIESNDVDLVTNASVNEMLDLFVNKFKSIDVVGKIFGVLVIEGIEVVQFRSESYEEVGKPEIRLVGGHVEDSKRRDFTVNALYEDIEGSLWDPQNSVRDIRGKRLVSVGEPDIRFKEDPSRILRAIYLSKKLGFEIDCGLEEGIVRNRYMLEKVPWELKGKILKKSYDVGELVGFIKGLYVRGILSEVFEGLEEGNIGVWERLSLLNKGESIEVIMSMLYYVREAEVKEDLNKLGLGKKLYEKVDKVLILIKMFGKELDSIWLRRVSGNVRCRRDMVEIIDICVDVSSKLESKKESEVVIKKKELNEEMEEGIYFVSELVVDGNYLISKGVKGKRVGEVLRELVLANVKEEGEVGKFIKGMENS